MGVEAVGRLGIGLPLIGGVVALARADLEVRTADRDLDLAELPVVPAVRGDVADQVVGLQLVGRLLHSRQQIVGVAEAEAAGVQRHRVGPLRFEGRAAQGRGLVLLEELDAVFRGRELVRAGEAAGVEEVDGGVGAAHGADDRLEFRQGAVVDEAVGHEDHGLAAPALGQRVPNTLQGAERGLVPLFRVDVGLGGPRHDEGGSGDIQSRDRLSLVLVPGIEGDVVLGKTAQHLGADPRVPVHVDAHGLVVGDPVARRALQPSALQPIEHGQEVGPRSGPPARPPDATGRRGQEDLVVVPHALLKELGDGLPGPLS